jgi:hypothetical protein
MTWGIRWPCSSPAAPDSAAAGFRARRRRACARCRRRPSGSEGGRPRIAGERGGRGARVGGVVRRRRGKERGAVGERCGGLREEEGTKGERGKGEAWEAGGGLKNSIGGPRRC